MKQIRFKQDLLHEGIIIFEASKIYTVLSEDAKTYYVDISKEIREQFQKTDQSKYGIGKSLENEVFFIIDEIDKDIKKG